MVKGKNFVGQPILSQVLNCIPKSIIRAAVNKHQADRYYKKIPTHTHLTSLLYGVLSGCSGLREICEGMLACDGSTIFEFYIGQPMKRVKHQEPEIY